MTKYIGPKTDGENVATQADKLSLSSETPDALTPDQAGAAGTATTAARSDHQHEILAGAAGTIMPDAASAEGSSSSFARADHTHAIDAAAPSANLTASTTNTEGTSNSFSRADHSHAVTTGAPTSNLTASTSNASGSSASLSRADHSHAIDTAAPSANLTASTTNAVGTSANLARSDHSHAITTGAPGTILPDDAAATGTSASLARADHTHAIVAASAGTITGTNSEGTASSFARSDHNHAIGIGWTSYPPVIEASTTNPTAGTGATRNGRYIQVGKLVTYQFLYQFGSSMNAGSGLYRLILPVTSTRVTLGKNLTAGTVRLYDSSTNKNIQLNFFVHDNDAYIRMAWFAHNDGANDVTATSPWTWEQNDVITGTITYEAA